MLHLSGSGNEWSKGGGEVRKEERSIKEQSRVLFLIFLLLLFPHTRRHFQIGGKGETLTLL